MSFPYSFSHAFHVSLGWLVPAHTYTILTFPIHLSNTERKVKVTLKRMSEVQDSSQEKNLTESSFFAWNLGPHYPPQDLP